MNGHWACLGMHFNQLWKLAVQHITISWLCTTQNMYDLKFRIFFDHEDTHNAGVYIRTRIYLVCFRKTTGLVPASDILQELSTKINYSIRRKPSSTLTDLQSWMEPSDVLNEGHTSMSHHFCQVFWWYGSTWRGYWLRWTKKRKTSNWSFAPISNVWGRGRQNERGPWEYWYVLIVISYLWAAELKIFTYYIHIGAICTHALSSI